MRVIGIDPGGTVGHVALLVEGGRAAVAGAPGTWTPAEALAVPWRAGDVVALEHATDIHPALLAGGVAKCRSLVRSLLSTEHLGGRIEQAVLSAGGRVVLVDAAEARRSIGVRIGGSRKKEPCATCKGSGADASAEGLVARARAGELLQRIDQPGRGRRAARGELLAMRIPWARTAPCDACDGSGVEAPSSVDQQVKRLLPLLVSGWPAKSNAHERDAAVVALWAAGALGAEQAPGARIQDLRLLAP